MTGLKGSESGTTSLFLGFRCTTTQKANARKLHLEVLLTPNEVEVGVCVHVALDVQSTTQYFWPAEENTSFCRAVDFTNALEDHVPVGAAKVRRRSKTCDGVGLRVCIVDHDIGSIIHLDLRSEVLDARQYHPDGLHSNVTYRVDLNVVLKVLSFNSE